MTTKKRDDADDIMDLRRDERSDTRKDERVSARRTKDAEGREVEDTTHLPESHNEPEGSDVLAGIEGDGENTLAAKAAVGEPVSNGGKGKRKKESYVD